MKQIKIPGFTSNIKATDKPTVSVFGEEGSGKTRFAATAPDPIGLLPLDGKSKRTFELISSKIGATVIAPTEPFFKPSEAIAISLLDADNKESLKKVITHYTNLYRRVLEDAMRLAESPDIATIVVDSNTAFWDWILFSHFGRRNQIESYQRGAVNQDMSDFIAALKHKNLILLHRAAEIWKDTGEVDKQGRKKQAPSGKFKAEGCSKLGYLVNLEIELISAPKATNLNDKFKIKIRECQTNPIIEGEVLDDYQIMGEEITWDNVIGVINWD